MGHRVEEARRKTCLCVQRRVRWLRRWRVRGQWEWVVREYDDLCYRQQWLVLSVPVLEVLEEGSDPLAHPSSLSPPPPPPSSPCTTSRICCRISSIFTFFIVLSRPSESIIVHEISFPLDLFEPNCDVTALFSTSTRRTIWTRCWSLLDNNAVYHRSDFAEFFDMLRLMYPLISYCNNPC